MITRNLVRLLAVLLNICLAVPAFSAGTQAALVSPATTPATQQTATLLPDGRTFLTGGLDTGGNPTGAIAIRDTRGNERSLPVTLQFARSGHTATVLPDGTVLVLGGIGNDGLVVAQAEIFDPATETVRLLLSMSPAPRVFHSATLLTDGRVLIAGGFTANGAASTKIEIFDPRQKTSAQATSELTSTRHNHVANLLPDGRVLLTGGKDGNGNPLVAADVFDPLSLTVVPATNAEMAPSRDTGIAETMATSPEDHAVDVPLDALLSMRFSRPLQIATINNQTVELRGPLGAVEAKIVGAENGMLAFITPRGLLAPGTVYSVRISGALDSSNINVAFAEFTFTTVAGETQDEVWTPNFEWTTHAGASAWQSLAPLQAPPGVTALAGQVLKLDGTPLKHVMLQIGTQKTFSDNTGRFLLTGLTAGPHPMVILGETANTPARRYGVFEVRVDIQEHRTNVLRYTIWMTPLDTAHAVRIASPTLSETVITTPLLPGLELHLPANTVITDRNGNAVTEISITPIPLDRPPFPLPRVPVPIYFTIQPGSAYIHVNNASGPKGARLFYPNRLNYPPGTPYQFWNYDADQKGWFIYGAGRVSANRAQIIPNPGVEIYEFTGAMVANPGNAPPDGPRPGDPNKDGEPVDLSTGLFVYQKADLTLPDLITLKLTRTYRQNDPVSRAFGVGTSLPYDMFMIGDNETFPEGYTFQDLILADGGRIHFQRISPCTGTNGFCNFGDAVYQDLTSGTDFHGAIIRQQGCSPNGFWTLTKKDGTVFCFPDSDASNNPRSSTPRSIRDRHGNTLAFTHDSNGNLTQITSPGGRWIQFSYDASNRITQAKDNIGRIVAYSYDAGGRLAQVTDANGGLWNYTYDAFSQMTSIQDPRGIFYLTNQYDTNGRVIRQTQADNSTFLFNYTTDPVTGRVTQTDVTDPRGTVRRTTFNANGYKTSFVLAVGQPEQLTITYNRDPNTNLPNSIVDGLGHQTSFAYDSLGNTTSMTRMAGTPDAVTNSFTYEPSFNQLATFTDALNRTTTMTHDAVGDLTTIRDPLGNQTAIVYNSSGMPVTITDALGNVTQFSYDGFDLVDLTDPIGNTTTRFVDGAGRIADITDPLGRNTRYIYNALNQVVQTVDQMQGVTTVSYDPNGNPVSLTNSLGNAVSWTYDNMDRLATQTDALLRTESYKYDGAGNLVSVTDRKGQVTTYKYDRLNRQIFSGFGTHGSGASATYDSTISYQYDGGGRLVQAVDSQTGTITRAYDTLDRLTSEVTPQGSITYGYDAIGRRTSMTVAGQPQVSYSYDDADRLTQILQGGSAVNFAYDAAGRRTSLTLPNGVSLAYTYDSRSLVTGITYSLGAVTLGNLVYAYDEIGRRTQMGGSFARTDLPQPLLSASYDASNELTSWNGVPFSYDANGSMLSDGANSFVWDARNQLVTLNGAGLQYDAFGRRTRNAAGTSFLYDMANPVQELNGATVAANILTGGIDEIFTRATSSGTFAVLQDILGSAVAVADSSGTIQTSYTYDPFGNTSTAGAVNANPSQYTGRENDGGGLYYYRARYYAPAIGRFIAEDPLGFGGGANYYAYAENDPINWIDPLGLAVDAPGFWEGLIPIWGSARQSIHDFQCGNYVWGTVNAALAISDVFLVKSLVTAAGKVGVEGLAKVSGSHTWDATRKWMTREGWRDFPGQNFHHWAIPQGGWGEAVPDFIKNQPWNIMRMTAEDHTALHQMDGLNRLWNGTPTWAKVAGADAAGKAANAGRSCGCD